MARSRSEAAYLKALGAAVRAVREQQELSQEELGFEADLDRTYISGIERGVRNPTVTSLCKIAAALGTSPAQFLVSAESKRGRA